MATLEDPTASSGTATNDILTIAEDGDLLLEASHEKRAQVFTYRVHTTRLQKSSGYFQRLIDPRFGEGRIIQSQLETVKSKYGKTSNIPLEDLPRVRVSDIGKTSEVSSIKMLFRDFLKVLHDQDIATNLSSPGIVAVPLVNIANLSVVADRFDALQYTAAYVHRKNLLQNLDARNKVRTAKMTEERLRQRILVGLLFEYAPWVLSASQSLIMTGSSRWTAEVAPTEDNLPLWWDLPRGFEDELIARRDYAVDTLQSLALHFTALYSSGIQQCRLGYANSWVCDSFQFGEMIKFMKKQNLIKLGPVLTGQDEAESYAKDLERILDIYKSCPAHRIDEFHAHCGLRTRLIPLIEQLEPYFRIGSGSGIGICGDCWQLHKSQYAWSLAKRPVAWSASVPRLVAHTSNRNLGSEECLRSHAKIRDMFTAMERDWTPKEEQSESMRFGRSTPFLKYD